MKVLQILGCKLESGAGKAIHALHVSLLQKGIESRLLGRLEDDLPADLHATPISARHRIPVSLLTRAYLWRQRRRFGHWPPDFYPVSFGLDLQNMKGYREADILHIQWANASTMGPSLWQALRSERRPVIWTLRDMWLMTGGCHFSDSCERYQSGCGDCPKLGAAERLTSDDVEFKRQHMPPHSVIVALSSTIANQARQSRVLKDHDIRVIANSNNLNELQLIDQSVARSAQVIPADAFVAVAGALNFADPRKGGHVLARVIGHFKDDRLFHTTVFGVGLAPHVAPCPVNCNLLGNVSGNQRLNQLYAAADIFLMPSLQESFGKVTVEAMASGTPVIAFRGTPAEDIITDGVTGWLVPHGDAAAFLQAVQHARCLTRDELSKMGRAARQSVLKRFSADTVADQHIKLYEDLLAGGGT
jgi:glycosyltransferase involved in cell wall biosynthesis